MPPPTPAPTPAAVPPASAWVDALAEAYAAVTAAVTERRPRDYLRPTLTEGWCICDLLFHLLLDAQRALVALASPADGPATVDRVSYWAPHHPSAGDEGVGHARFVRIAAAAYSSPSVLVSHWTTTSAATIRAARAANPSAVLETQGVRIGAEDLVATLVVEAGIHHLDLTAHLPDAGPAPAAALALTRGVLEQLLGAPFPASWPDAECALLAGGRHVASAEQRAQLGEAAERLPLLG